MVKLSRRLGMISFVYILCFLNGVRSSSNDYPQESNELWIECG